MTIVDPGRWGPAVPSVDVLERELARHRRSRSAYAREHPHAVARAAVLNLVVVATREVHALRATRTAERLAQRHPSRAILVLIDRAGAPGIRLHAQLPPEGQPDRVSYEQLAVRASAGAEERIASAVIPLLLPDLPVFLWWTETPPIGRRHFEQLAAMSTRFIVDSADFARPEQTLPALSAMRASWRGFAITDLNWARVTPWRELVTQLFDVPACRPFLGSVEGVRVGFSVDADGRQIHPSQAFLLAGWLGSRLGWTATDPLAPSEAGGHLFSMRRPDGGGVRIRVRPRFERGMSEGDVSGIVVEATHGGRSGEFRVRRRDRHAVATVVIDGTTMLQRVVPLPAPDVGELLSEELAIVGGDRVYEDALDLIDSLA